MKLKFITTGLTLILLSVMGKAQQFNTDNYFTMPHGTCTFVLTAGQRNATFINSFALVQNWEFFAQANLYWENQDNNLSQHFTTTLYMKYMFYENAEKTGGFAAFLGYGKAPGYYEQSEFLYRHTNIWTAVPITIPLFNNVLSWDIMPGGMVDFDYGNSKEAAWGFTYSTRMAIYKIIPECAIVGEYYGAAGELYSTPEYKAGIRWEPNETVVSALTYGSAIEGLSGPGFEIGVVIFSPPFLKL